MDKYQYTAMLAEHYERQRKAREAATHDARAVITHYQSGAVGIVLPFMQSAITAFLAGILVTIGAVHWWAWSWYKTFGVAFIVIMLADWMRRCGAWSRSVQAMEQALQFDINQDGWIGPEPDPEPVQESVELHIIQDDTGRQTWASFPVSRSKMCEFAHSLMQGQPFSVSGFSGPGALFTRGQYDKTIAELIKRDLAEKVNPEIPNSTIQLTTRGWHTMRALAGEHRGVHPETIPLPHYQDK